MPPGFHAGGLRYHGMAPLVSHLKELGLIEARRLPPDARVSRRACFFARTRASCRRPRPTTPSRARSTRRFAAGTKASREPSCSISAATATSTCRPTGLLRRQAHRSDLRRARARDGIGRAAVGLRPDPELVYYLESATPMMDDQVDTPLSWFADFRLRRRPCRGAAAQAPRSTRSVAHHGQRDGRC